MTQRYHNPFINANLMAPSRQREDYKRYCQTAGRAVIDHSPFPRMVDFWFTSLSLAVRKQLKPVELPKPPDSFKITDGIILDSDSWRVQAVMLIAIAVTDDVKIAGEPGSMMAIANGLAAAGVPHLVELLRSGDQDPIWNLSDALDEILSTKET